MINRIVEVADDRRHLSVSRGFMVIQGTEGGHEELGRIPLDDIAAVIANAHGLSYTNNVLVALLERGAPLVVCGTNHNALGMLWSVGGNYQQAKRFDAQIAASKPMLKRLWAEVVKAKLQKQVATLAAVGVDSTLLRALIGKVRSGDPENLEAQGARRYWTLLFGDSFRRDQGANGANAMLNYGYTVLRAATARAIIAAGLHPTVGLHHSNEGNPMRLADDLMEPFRPLIDLKVRQLHDLGQREVTAANKRALVHLLYEDMQSDAGATPMMVCVQKLATSLAQVLLGDRSKLELPLPSLPLTLAGSTNVN